LRYRGNFFSVALDGEERGRRREVAVPNIVVDSLKMPDSFAGLGIHVNQSIYEEIVTDAISAVEIVCN